MIGRTRAYLAALVAAVTVGLAGPVAVAEPVATPTPEPQVSAPGTPVVEPLDPRPTPVDVTVRFDKTEYQSGDPVRAELTFRNTGTTRLEHLRGAQDTGAGQMVVDHYTQWGDLITNTGITLEAGASHTITLTGRMERADSEAVVLSGFVHTNETLSVRYSKSAPVKRVNGKVSGLVYTDKNGNGTYDAGEHMPDAKVVLAFQWSGKFTTTSDNTGRFAFEDIPTAEYRIESTESPDGWTQVGRPIKVTPAGVEDLEVRAVRADVSGVLQAKVAFTEDVYEAGDLAHVTVTLTNTGDLPLTGISANCNRIGDSHGLNGTGDGWGDLAGIGPGVTIGPGRTLVLDVSEKVPAFAFNAGEVFVDCDFGYAGVDHPGNPDAWDTAPVPGGIGGAEVEVLYYPDGYQGPRQGVPGVRIVLVDEKQCHVEEKVTDDKGLAAFVGLRVGTGKYTLYYFPPSGWRMADANPSGSLRIFHGDTVRLVPEVAKGDGQLPVLPEPSPDCGQPPPGTQPPGDEPGDHPGDQPGDEPGDEQDEHPAGQPARGRVVRLADTGADVIGLGTAGVVLLLLGIGGVVASRRRGPAALRRSG